MLFEIDSWDGILKIGVRLEGKLNFVISWKRKKIKMRMELAS